MSERDEIHELALKFIESEEMREYWSDTLLSGNMRFEGLLFDPARDCRAFITGSRSSIDDNCDCCAVACIYCDADGYLYCSTLKHNMNKLLTKVSPLYRAEKFMGELPENEQALKIISEAIKKIPSVRMNSGGEYIWRQHELAEQFDEFFNRSYYKKQNGSFDCSWDEFRERFKL